MTDEIAAVLSQVRGLVDEYRGSCLWFLRDDYYPTTPTEATRVLAAIERHGDVTAFRKAATLRRWLSLHFSAPSAAS